MGTDDTNSKTIENNSGGRGFASHPENINREGRPPAGWSWAELLRDMGEEIEPKTGKQFKQLVTKRIWLECVNGNVGAIKELFNRMEGMPKQNMDLNVNEKPKFVMSDDNKI